MLFTCVNEVNPGTHELGLTALMEVTAEEAHEIEIIVDIDDAGELEARIISYTDPEHTEYDVLTSTVISSSNAYLLQFTPTTDTVWLWIGRKAEHGFASGTKFKVTGTTTAKTTWTVYQMNIQGLLHSWRSPYRFAYNGQERVDDIKGKTNHNTALYWEYDTRRAWRWNKDPKPVFGISSYSVFRSNPILNRDALGDVFDPANGSKQKADAAKNDAKSKIKDVDGQIAQEEANRKNASARRAEKIDERIKNLKEQRNEFAGMINEIETMESSTQVYSLVELLEQPGNYTLYGDGNQLASQPGGTYYKDGKVVMEYK